MLLKKKMEQKLLTQIMEISEYKVEINLGNLLRFYLFHLFYFFAAPLAIFVVAVLHGIGLTKNLGFWPAKSPFFVVQFSTFMAICVLTYILFWEKPKNVYLLEWGSLILYIFFRCFIISVRYSFASKFRMKTILTKVVGQDFIAEDLFA